MEINKNIFREYDIRGVAGVHFDDRIVAEYERFYGKFPGVTINLDTSRAIGRAYGTRIRRAGGKEVLLGYEERPYAKELQNAFMQGILDTGVNVAHVGTTTTPFVYFLTSHCGFDGGVNVTGSHNIYFFNGFKMMKRGTSPMYGEELQELYRQIIDEDYDLAATRGVMREFKEAYTIYKQYVLQHVTLARPLKVAVDTGNGSAGPYIVDFLEGLGCEVVGKLYLEPDAYYPNHVPDPELPKNVKELGKVVVESGADIGIGIDADADRIGFLNERGEFIFSDDILLLLSRDVLSRNPGGKILFDTKGSKLIADMVPQFGGVPFMHRTGHANIKDTMRKDTSIVLAGEASHHLFFAEDYYRIDDGFYGIAQVLRLLSEFHGSFSQMFTWIPKRVRTPEIKLPCYDEVKFDVVGRIRDSFMEKHEVITIDGARVVLDDTTWGLVRCSNTSPFLTIKLEAETEKRFLEMKNILADELEKHPEVRDRLDRKNVYSLTGVLGYV